MGTPPRHDTGHRAPGTVWTWWLPGRERSGIASSARGGSAKPPALAMLPGSRIPANPEGRAGSAQATAARHFPAYLLLLLPAPGAESRAAGPRVWGGAQPSSREAKATPEFPTGPARNCSAWHSDVTGAQA